VSKLIDRNKCLWVIAGFFFFPTIYHLRSYYKFSTVHLLSVSLLNALCLLLLGFSPWFCLLCLFFFYHFRWTISEDWMDWQCKTHPWTPRLAVRTMCGHRFINGFHRVSSPMLNYVSSHPGGDILFLYFLPVCPSVSLSVRQSVTLRQSVCHKILCLLLQDSWL
jgi:hypothetical protein